MLKNANRTGFVITNTTSFIDKDPLAILIYTFDWTDWLEGDVVVLVNYTAVARRNDPEPIEIIDQGAQGNTTFVKLSGGQLNKSYTITADIITANGLRDRRDFRVNIVNRSA